MSNNLGAGKILGLLDNLKAVIEDFAARADKLNADFRLQTAKERQRCQSATEEQNRQLTASVAEADGLFQTLRTAAQARFEQRKARIGKAYQSSKTAALRHIDDKAGARKYGLQKTMLQAERDRDAGLAGATAAFEEFRRDLAVEQESLEQKERAAQRAFRGCRKFQRGFQAAYEKADADLSPAHDQLLARLRELLTEAGGMLGRLRGSLLFGVARYFPAWFALAVVALPAPLVPLLQRFGINAFTYPEAAGVAGAGAVLLVLRLLALRGAALLAASLSHALAGARRLHDACFQKSEAHYHQEHARIKAAFATATQTVDRQLKHAVAEAGDMRVACRMTADERTVHINERSQRMYQDRVARLQREYHDAQQRLKQSAEVRIKALASACDDAVRKFTAAHEAAWAALEAEWNRTIAPLYGALNTARAVADRLFPPWQAPVWKEWQPHKQFAQAARFAELQADLRKLCQALPKDSRLALPGPSAFSVPLCLECPEQGSVLFETTEAGHDQAIASLNNIILRLLSAAPPGRVNFTILDPVGLGQNFAGVMHLADFEEQLINSRIWTQMTQIEQKLADLNEHMEKVIQMYLRNEYQTIAEYNEQAGVIAEKYHFLVVADFPANFSETAIKRLLSIAASGARCGVYTLIHWDHRQPLPQDFIPDDLRKNSVCVVSKDKGFVLAGRDNAGTALVLDAAPAPEFAIEFVQRVGRFSRDSSRVEVPFEHVAPAEAEVWTEDTTSEVRVPIGRTGATKLQYLEIGKGTRQHGLIAGKTGSGKSTLFHVIITNLSLWCSPEQVEFYLVDFKKGVEFKCYASRRLPHARVVAIESDREFGLSVLQRIDEELRRRGDLFRQLGVQDIAGYKRAGGTESIPRTLLLVDEFQEFFVEDDKVSQTASLLLDRIVRQGRAFGIHVLLGSQTLGGAYTVARTTLGQMVIRIALQCNEADAYLIMDDTNPAPRLLSRPGEGIYNDMAGALEGNSPFQAVWLPEEVRDGYLSRIRERADRAEVQSPKSKVQGPRAEVGQAYPGPIVFEGNAPADVAENPLLANLLASGAVKPAAAPRIWLGAPNSIKGPTEAVFRRQSGNNLLVVGQRDEAALAILSVGLVSLAAQFPPNTARFILLDATPPGTGQRTFLEKVVQSVPHPVTLAKPAELGELMKGLGEEMKQRSDSSTVDPAPPVFLLIHGLQQFGKLRYEEDFGFSTSDAEAAVNPAVILNNLVCEGARLGFHVIATCDTYNNVTRFLSRKALSEFEMRVLFQMSVNDSASLIDNPKAGMLGLHRALFYNAQEGYLETFRPYALPSNEWLEQAAQHLARLLV